MASSLKEYLKKYVSNDEDDKKKRLKKKKKTKQVVSQVVLVDEDPVWHKHVDDEDDEADVSAEEKPQVDEDIEVKRMNRLEQLRSRRPYNAISEDGSGWVNVSDTPAGPNSDVRTNDLSPPRKGGSRFDTPPEPESGSPHRHRRTQDREVHDREHAVSPRRGEDISPPRRRQPQASVESIQISGDISPPSQRRPQASAESSQNGVDISPPCRRRPQASAESSQNGVDISPPRRRRPQASAENSQNGGDISPPRRVGQNSHVPDLSPPRKKRHYSPSPVPEALTGDNSPPRRSRPVAKEDPRRKSFQQDRVPADLSPPRKNRCVSESSPSPESSPVRRSQSDAFTSKERPKTGLVTGKDIKDEISKVKKNALLRFQEMDPSVTGRDAEAVYRDKTGKRISKEEYLKSKKGEEKPKEIKLEWGKGLAQKREAEQRLQDLELEKEKPFARTRDDPELDSFLKDRPRWGDPMAHLVKKKNPELNLPDLGGNDKMKESGFIVPQDIPKHSWLKRGLDAAPNRYGIRPGRHWDGVDRSNGSEKDLFKRMNEKRATEQEAYLWSVSDM